MAQRPHVSTRRPGSNSDTYSEAFSRRKYALRHSAKRILLGGSADSHAKHVATATTTASRPVLVPLQFNLRRLPSRSRLMAPLRSRDSGNNIPTNIQVGSKRKRINENSYISSRNVRAVGRFKRQRSQNESSDEDSLHGRITMDVDEIEENPASWSSDLSETEEPLIGDYEYLIHEADSRQLNRLRKDELWRLYEVAGLSSSVDDLTKSDIIHAIISSRNDDEEVPPSSPPGKSEGGYSTDDGHDGGGEETDANLGSLKNALRRRGTVQDMGRPIIKNTIARSISLGTGDDFSSKQLSKKTARIAKDVKSPHHDETTSSRKRRGVSAQISPAASSISYTLPSPPVTRLRSRTISNESKCSSTFTTASNSAGPSRAKGLNATGSSKYQKGEEKDREHVPKHSNPSPRRLRSKKIDSSSSRDDSLDAQETKTRIIPMRKAKKSIGSLKEDSTTTESGDGDECIENEDIDEDEVDELDSSPSPLGSPEPRLDRLKEQRTPLKRRLRPRKIQTHTPPSDGDDERDDGDEDLVDNLIHEESNESDDESDNEKSAEDQEEAEAEELVDGEDDEDEDEEEEEVDGEEEEREEEEKIEPRILRNGKVVGEEMVEEEEEEIIDDSDIEVDQGSDDLEETAEVDDEMQDDEDDEEEGEEGDDNGDGDEQEVAEEEVDDEEMEEEFDLSSATQKTLVRLRRDDLVRLCETRELDTEGTKPQLAQALLRWRDSNEDTTTAPSSASTARPPSVGRATGRRRRTRSTSKSTSATPPVLLRSHRIHEDEPVTPPLSKEKKDGDGELELDLESLGLEDREIPPDKLTKCDKIGSGGFKDVFTGRFKGRRVAIAEFRDQLSAMDIKELKLLAEFSHPNIVRFLGVSIPENTRETPVMIVSELCSNGDLFDYVRNVSPPSLYKVLCMMLDIARGLEYLHNRKPSVIHRDCKSSNILITSKGTAKIADFGLAKVKQSTRSMVRSLVGTVNWQAPELWHPHPKYNHKVDVFSCACVYWEMLQWHNPNKKYPWEGMNEHAIYEAVGQKRQRPSLTSLRKQWCPDIVDLVERMWAQDHQDRPGMTEVVEELQRIIKEYR